MKSIFLEILALFSLGGLYYLYQRRKYIRLHEKITIDFMDQLKEKAPLLKIPQNPKDFEYKMVRDYNNNGFESYPNDAQEILADYMDYIHSLKTET